MSAVPFQSYDGREQPVSEAVVDHSTSSIATMPDEVSTEARTTVASTRAVTSPNIPHTSIILPSTSASTSTTQSSSSSSPSSPSSSNLTLPLASIPDQDAIVHSILLALPQEVLLNILAFLDVPDLVAVSRTCRTLHLLPSDPLLHRQRLRAVPPRLSHSLSVRPHLNTLRPPNANIYLTTTLAAARAISRNLVRARLRRQLNRRSPVTELVDRGVLPGECFVLVASTRSVHGERNRGDAQRPDTSHGSSSLRKSISSARSLADASSLSDTSHNIRRDSTSSSNTLISSHPRSSHDTVSSCKTSVPSDASQTIEWSASQHYKQKYVSPCLIEAKRAVEREAIRARIRGWVDGRGKQELERRRRELELELQNANDKPAGSVMGLVRMFRAQGRKNGGDNGGIYRRTTNVRDHSADQEGANIGQRSTDNGPSSSTADVQHHRDRERWGRGAAKWIERRRREPTRAHVLGLRRFWEGVGREG